VALILFKLKICDKRNQESAQILLHALMLFSNLGYNLGMLRCLPLILLNETLLNCINQYCCVLIWKSGIPWLCDNWSSSSLSVTRNFSVEYNKIIPLKFLHQIVYFVPFIFSTEKKKWAIVLWAVGKRLLMAGFTCLFIYFSVSPVYYLEHCELFY